MGVRKTGRAPEQADRGNRKTGRPPLQSVGVRRLGVAMVDFFGRPFVLSYDAFLAAVGAGNVTGPVGGSTDKAIARWDGTDGKHLQDSLPLVEDDGRISTLTDPVNAQDAATKAYVDAQIVSGGGAAVAFGKQRSTADGVLTAYDLVDVASYVLIVTDNGLEVDPATYSLSADGTQIVFAVAPTATHLLVFTYQIKTF